MLVSRIAVAAVLGAAATAAAQQFVVSTYAGGPSATLSVAGVGAAIGSVQGIATDAAGNVYFTTVNPSSPAYYHGQAGVFKLDRGGTLARLAGNTGVGFSGDGGPALQAQLRLSNFDEEPGVPGIAVDGAGNVYIADSGNNRVRRVSSAGIITTVAGNGIYGDSGDGGPATSAQLAYPSGLAVDRAGNLYIGAGNHVRKVSPDGMITTVTEAPDGSAIAVDVSGNLYVAGGGSVRQVTPDGNIMTVEAQDVAVAVDSDYNVYLANGGRVRKISSINGSTVVAGTGTCGYSGDGVPATTAQICASGVAVDSQGNLFVADATNQRIYKVSPDGILRTIAGNGTCCFSGDGGLASKATLNLAPWGGAMAIDRAGNLYVADTANQHVRKISPSGIITTVAGNGVSNGFSGDGGPATSAQLNYPSGLAVDSAGNLYIADVGNQRLRKVSPAGTITTVAQVGGRALAVDGADNIYFLPAVPGIGKISASGKVTTVSSVPFGMPYALAADAAGNIYIAELGGNPAAPNYQVRKLAADGSVTLVAGQGTPGYSGDGGPAVSARLNGPVGLAVDHAGDLYIADSFNGRIRMVSPSGTITTVAGDGGTGYSGDGGPAIDAQLGSLSALAIDGAGNLFAADQYYNTIRLLRSVSSSTSIRGVVNAASNLAGPIAPGEMVILTGTGLGPARLVPAAPASDGQAGNELAGTMVQFNGTPAHLIYTSATQVAAIVPDSVSGSAVQVSVTYQDQTASVSLQVAPAAPGIFTADATGRGHAATINQNGSVNAAAEWGDVITLFVTGAGHATPTVITAYPDLPEIVFPIIRSDAMASVPGVMQIEMQIPPGLDCDQPVVVQVGGMSSQAGVTISLDVCI